MCDYCLGDHIRIKAELLNSAKYAFSKLTSSSKDSSDSTCSHVGPSVSHCAGRALGKWQRCLLYLCLHQASCLAFTQGKNSTSITAIVSCHSPSLLFLCVAPDARAVVLRPLTLNIQLFQENFLNSLYFLHQIAFVALSKNQMAICMQDHSWSIYSVLFPTKNKTAVNICI